MKNIFQTKAFNIYLGIFLIAIGILGSWSLFSDMMKYLNDGKLKYLFKDHITFTGEAAFYMSLALFIAGFIFIVLGISYLHKSRDYN